MFSLLFISSILHHIIGQQISSKAQATIWNRLLDLVNEINIESISSLEAEILRSIGISHRKVEYIQAFIQQLKDNSINLDSIATLTDEKAIQQLITIKGGW